MRKHYIKFILLLSFAFLISGITAFSEDDINMDFESSEYAEGVSPDEADASWTITTTLEKDSVAVEQDSLSGSKALKFSVAPSGKVTAEYDISNLTSGKYWYSFQYRSENGNGKAPKLGAIRTDNGWYGVININTIDADSFVRYTNNNTYFGSYASNTNYADVRIFIDADTRTHKAYFNGAEKFSGTYRVDANPEKIFFEITNPKNEENVVWWIDNIKLEPYKLEVSDYSPKTVSDCELNSEIYVKFNTLLKDSSISKDDFIIEENDETLSKDKYSVLSSDKTTVKLSLEDGLDYGKKYKIIAKKSVLPDDIGYKLLKEDFSFDFNTKSIIKSISGVDDGMRYNDPVTPVIAVEDGITFDLTLSKDDGEETSLTYGSTISEKGTYVLTVTAKDGNDKKEIIKISFAVVDKVVPEARNLSVSGDAETGKTLKGNYEFYDVNGDEPGNHIFSWYRCDTPDGEYKQILLNADKEDYILTKDDEDKYIKFGIIPVSKNEPYTDNIVVMTNDAFTGAFKPELKSLKLTPSAKVPNKDVELKVEAEYFDLNGDEKDKIIYTWKKSSDGVNFDDITGETTDTYKLKEADKNLYIICEVTPISKKAPFEGKTEETEIYKTFFEPVIKNVRIEGTAQVNQVLAAFYEYYDENGDEKGDIKCEWIVGGNVVSTDEAFVPSSIHAGQMLTLRVTPVSKNYPFTGNAVTTEPVVIMYGVVQGGTSFGGGSSSGGGGSKTFSSAAQTVTPPQEDKKEENKQEEVNKISFKDIENHWANAEIKKLCDKGIINGISENEFAPDMNLTRAQFATVIARALSLNKKSDTLYNDINSDAWYNDAVGMVTEAKLMQGSEGNFYPDKEITREEMCVVINNILKYKNITVDGAKKEFSDAVSVSSWAKESIDNISAMGIINGMENNMFAPKSNSTRAQMAVILNRLLNIMGGDF